MEPGGPAGGVEIDDALLDGDLRGAGHQRLGDRRQLEHPLGVAVGGQHPGGSDHRGGGIVHRPIGKGVESVSVNGGPFMAM